MCDEEMRATTSFETYSFSYTWTIPDFYLFKSYYTNGNITESTEFSPKQGDVNVKWKMSFQFFSGRYGCILVCLTPLIEPKQETWLNAKCSILVTDGKETAHFQEAENQRVVKDTQIRLYYYFTTVNELTVSNDKHLVDGSLTLQCKVFCRSPLPKGVSLLTKQYRESQFNLTAELEEARQNSMLTDVTLLANGKALKAHKLVLAIQSTFFKTRFAQRWDREDTDVQMNDVDPDILEGMLEFMYTGKSNVVDKEAEKMLKVADEYGLERLKSACEKQLSSELTKENFTHIILLAETHNAKRLKQSCFNFAAMHPASLNEI